MNKKYHIDIRGAGVLSSSKVSTNLNTPEPGRFAGSHRQSVDSVRGINDKSFIAGGSSFQAERRSVASELPLSGRFNLTDLTFGKVYEHRHMQAKMNHKLDIMEQ